MKTYERGESIEQRADIAFGRGKLVQAWFMWVEAANETNSPTRKQYCDRKMRRIESAIRGNPRIMRHQHRIYP